MSDVCTFVVCGAPLAVRALDVTSALVRSGWEVRPMLTPAAQPWVDAEGLEALTGNPVRVALRHPDEPKVTPRSTALVVAPLTFNSLTKLALGIADTQAHSTLAELLGERVPFVAVPMVNTHLAGHPAFAGHVETLTGAGVRWVNVVDGSAEPAVLDSDTVGEVVTRFDPAWITGVLTRLGGSGVAERA
ncbi:flavoprotein [Spongisporangium articulatum]|uniref:Flavoprotein n=1 Tax=Spongisporangium articulatum TaxID=3362603 RepID=A0ABW8AUA0_9ACTN